MIRYFLLLLSAAVLLNAQPSADDGSRSIRFSLFAENNAPAGLSRGLDARVSLPRIAFGYFDGEGIQTVDRPAEGFIGPFKGVVSGGKLRLYRPAASTAPEEAANAVLAEIPVPDNWNEVLLYAFSGIGTDRPRFIPLSDRSMLRSNGRSLCLNLTGRPIAVVVGDGRFLLDEGGIDEFDLKKAGDSGLISIKVAAEWQESWKLALSTSRRLRTDESYLFFFKTDDKSSRRIVLRIIDLPELN